MGSRHPDNVRFPPRPILVLTAADMLREKWRVRARCGSCGLVIWVDLGVIQATAGPDALMWGRHGRCKGLSAEGDGRCPGRMTFEAQSIQGGTWVALRDSIEARENMARRKAS